MDGYKLGYKFYIDPQVFNSLQNYTAYKVINLKKDKTF